MEELSKPGDCPKPTCRVPMHKDKVKDLTVAKPVSLQISGAVKSITAMYSDADMYEVEIEAPLVEKMDSKEEKSEDDSKSLADMKLGDLKKMISKPSDSKPKDDKEESDGK